MRKVIFKSYMGADKNGKPSFFDCSSFNERHLISMLQVPLNLNKVSFRIGHQIWAEQLSHSFNDPADPDIKDCLKWVNLGIVDGLAQLGYRIVPDESEIQII